MPNKQVRLTEEEITLIKSIREKQVDVIDLINKIKSLGEVKPQKQKVNAKVIKWNIPDKVKKEGDK